MDPIIGTIEQYIAATKMDARADKGYQMRASEMLALCDAADKDTSRAICVAFFFGKAKGYRAAKAVGNA